jgi:hypothetical protein
MAGANTGGYEVAFVVADHELTRIVQTAFIENFAPNGLPAERTFDADSGIVIPGGNGATATANFFGRFDLPRVTFDPLRDIVDVVPLDPPEHPANSIGITLPFTGSAFVVNAGPLSTGAFNLGGDITLVAPFGYPAEDGEDPSFGIDTDNMLVWLRFNDDDPDPLDDDRTTRDKIIRLFAGFGIGWTIFVQYNLEARMADALRDSDLARSLTGLGVGLDAGACPTGAVALPARQVLLTTPSTVQCVDFETLVRDDTTFLALKLKLTDRGVARGVDTTANALGQDWIRSNERAAILINNSFLLNDMLPPALISALLEQEFARLEDQVEAEVEEDDDVPAGDRDDVIDERFEEQSLELARDHFTAPLTINTPVAMFAELPLVPELEEDEDASDRPPNVFIQSIAINVVPDPDNAPERMVQATLTLRGDVTDLYTFDATVRINVRFGAGGGRPQVEVEADENNQIDVHPNPLAYGIPAGLGVLILEVFGPLLGSWIVLTTVAPVLVLVLVADVVADILAWFMLPGALNSNFDDINPDAVDVLPFLFSSATLDDLLYRGQLPVGEEASLNFLGFTPGNVQTFRLNLDAARFDLRRINPPDNPLFRDAFTGVAAAEADLACQGTTLTPSAGVRLHNFGLMPVWRALNLGQTDLRAAAFTGTNPLTLAPPDQLTVTQMAFIDPRRMADFTGLRVHTVGLRTDQGRFALLLFWNFGGTRLRCFYCAYNQALPGLLLLPSFPVTGALNPGDCRSGREHTRSVEVPIALDELLWPMPDSGLESPAVSVSVQVGYQELECVTRGTLEARPVLLLQPVSLAWTVITNDGVRHGIAPGAPVRIDVSPDEQFMDDTSNVTFELSGPFNQICTLQTERGKSGSFRVEVTSTSYGGVTFTAEQRVTFEGIKVRSVGFGTVRSLLDDLKRGVRDPSLGLGNPRPPRDPDPGPEPPFGPGRDPGGAIGPQPDRPGLPGSDTPSSPSGPGSGRRGGDSPRPIYMARPTTPSMRRRDRAKPVSRVTGETESKATLLDNVLQSFRELPAELAADPRVQGYMARITRFVASLPDPPTHPVRPRKEDRPEQPRPNPDQKA